MIDIISASFFVGLLALAAIGSFFGPRKPMTEEEEQEYRRNTEW